MCTRAELMFVSGMRDIDRYSTYDQHIHAYRSVCRPVVLDISASIVREVFDENSHELIVIQDVTVFQRTLILIINVLFDAIARLTRIADLIVSVAIMLVVTYVLSKYCTASRYEVIFCSFVRPFLFASSGLLRRT